MVHPETCELLGVIGWGETGVGLFGQDLQFLQNLTCTLSEDGVWRAFDEFDILQQEFWSTYLAYADPLPGSRSLYGKDVETIKTASRMSLLVYRGSRDASRVCPPRRRLETTKLGDGARGFSKRSYLMRTQRLDELGAIYNLSFGRRIGVRRLGPILYKVT